MQDKYNPLKEFLPSELAFKMKTIGFDNNCIGTYAGTNGIMFAGPVTYNKDHIHYKSHGAILIQQAEEWFLERFDWSIEIRSKTSLNTRCWYYQVDKDNIKFLEASGFLNKRNARLGAIEALLLLLPEGLTKE